MPEEISSRPYPIRNVYLLACRSLAAVLVETESMHHKLTSLGLSNVQIVPNFKVRASLAHREHRSSAGDSLKLIYLGRLRKEKGIFILANAVINLVRDHGLQISLHYYGDFLAKDSMIKGQFESFLKGTESFISIKGYISPDFVHETLLNYDALVFPTYFESEGFPGVIVDAAFAGIPVIATDCSHNTEFVEDGENGLICVPRDSRSLEEAVTYLYLNRDDCARMGLANYERSSRYDANLIAREIASLFL